MAVELNALEPLFQDREAIIEHLLDAIGASACRTTEARFDAIDAWLWHQDVEPEDVAFISIRVALITGLLLTERHDPLRFFFDTDPYSPLYGRICLANFQNQRGLDLIKASYTFCQSPRGRRLAAFAQNIFTSLQDPVKPP
jgi:hypothetical protein